MESDVARIRVRLRQLKAAFDDVHQVGLMSLAARDFQGAGAAIALERVIVKEHCDLCQQAIEARANRGTRARQLKA